MRFLRLFLKPGVDPRGAVSVLTDVVNAGRNVVASVPGGTLIGPGAIPLAEAYVRWVENVEGQLNALSLDLDLIDALHTSRYWRIRQLHEEPIRPVALVQAEIDRQTRWLEALRHDLQQRIDRAVASPGDPAVIDTNVLVEFVAAGSDRLALRPLYVVGPVGCAAAGHRGARRPQVRPTSS